MQTQSRKMFLLPALVSAGLVAACGGGSPVGAQQAAEPTITITDVPPGAPGGSEQMFPIAGTVAGIPAQSYQNYKVVIYVFAGDKWWVQPYDYAPKTSLSSALKFETETHGGSIYAALLVRPAYEPKRTAAVLPDVGGDVVARQRVAGKSN
ncbi:MAG TPA: hypothetical protein VHU83_04390 [Bryobacteraceae bacterium]|jgi:hypothetical protein|nr:hypothetical protein [Bryobacteraceae bacterium]